MEWGEEKKCNVLYLRAFIWFAFFSRVFHLEGEFLKMVMTRDALLLGMCATES